MGPLQPRSGSWAWAAAQAEQAESELMLRWHFCRTGTRTQALLRLPHALHEAIVCWGDAALPVCVPLLCTWPDHGASSKRKARTLLSLVYVRAVLICQEATSTRPQVCVPGPRQAFGRRGPREVCVASQLGARLRLSWGSEVLIDPGKAALYYSRRFPCQ